MENILLGHPGADQLSAHAMCLLAESESSWVAHHLARCNTCRTLLACLSRQAIASFAEGWLTNLSATAPAEPHCLEPCHTPVQNSESHFTGGPLTSDTLPYASSDEHDTSFICTEESSLPPGLAHHPRYALLELVGAGGMGIVYKAMHRPMQRLVALKVMNPRLVDRPGMAERFRQEVRAAARLIHPNIVTAHDAETIGPTHFLVMEYIEGTDLERLVSTRGPLSIARACNYLSQSARGLQHACERGMVHRDLKPHNIMLTPEGVIKILDFGLARFVSESELVGLDSGKYLHEETSSSTTAPIETGIGWVMGTADYIAPEEVENARTADIRADIYSLGCTLYRLLTGNVPFPGGSITYKIRSHFERRPIPVGELRATVPESLVEIVERMMAKSPQDRYQTPAQVAEALQAFA